MPFNVLGLKVKYVAVRTARVLCIGTLKVSLGHWRMAYPASSEWVRTVYIWTYHIRTGGTRDSLAIVEMQASCGLRYAIMLRPCLQVSHICCAGVQINKSDIWLLTLAMYLLLCSSPGSLILIFNTHIVKQYWKLRQWSGAEEYDISIVTHEFKFLNFSQPLKVMGLNCGIVRCTEHLSTNILLSKVLASCDLVTI